MLISASPTHDTPFAPGPVWDVQTPVCFNRLCARKFGVSSHLEGLGLFVAGFTPELVRLLFDVDLNFTSRLKRSKQVVDTFKPTAGLGADGVGSVNVLGAYRSTARSGCRRSYRP